jgi:hypothetical protein
LGGGRQLWHAGHGNLMGVVAGDPVREDAAWRRRCCPG